MICVSCNHGLDIHKSNGYDAAGLSNSACSMPGCHCLRFSDRKLDDVPDNGSLNASDVLQEVTEHHVKFLQARGYKTKTIEHAKKFIQNIPNDDERKGFFAEAAAWTESNANEKP